MQTQKMSLANIQGKLSRTEMKNIMAGSATCTLYCLRIGGIMCGSTNGANGGSYSIGNCIYYGPGNMQCC
jgi:hypothetical protein